MTGSHRPGITASIQDDLAFVPHLFQAAVQRGLACGQRAAAPWAARVLSSPTHAQTAIQAGGVMSTPFAAVGVDEVRHCLLIQALQHRGVRVGKGCLRCERGGTAITELDRARSVGVDLAYAVLLQFVQLAG